MDEGLLWFMHRLVWSRELNSIGPIFLRRAEFVKDMDQMLRALLHHFVPTVVGCRA